MTEYTDEGMLPGDYIYKVAAVNAAGMSAADKIDAAVWAPQHLASFDGTWDFPENPLHGKTVIAKFNENYRGTGRIYEKGVGNSAEHGLVG